MILHRVVAANVGPFSGPPVTAGPFVPGLNILSAPNETGKTTLLKAAGRALFDRHTCKADEIKNLRPAGTALAPAITVEFETGAGRFRIEKTFLQGPRSQLSEDRGGTWEPLADGDSADDRLNALLQSTKPGRGATDAAHWGMLGYLWMRQGELAEWPDWRKAPTGQAVQGMLVKLEIDPFIESVRGRMWSVFTENFTPSTHQPKVGGALVLAEADLVRVEAELADIARTRQQIQTDQEAFERLAGELPRLQAEHARCREQADALREAASQALVQQAEVERHRLALTGARARFRAVQQDQDALREHARRAEDLAGKLTAAQAETARNASEINRAQAALQTAEAAREEKARALAAAQEELARIGQTIRHRRLAEDVARTAQTLERCAAHAATLDRLTAARSEIPASPAARLARLEKLAESIQGNRTRLEALGLTVELRPQDPAAPITARRDEGVPEPLPTISGGGGTIHATQTLTLELPGWGTIYLRSGAGEARTLRDILAADEATLRQELATLGASTVADARALAEHARNLDRELLVAKQALAVVTGAADETVDTLRARLARDRRQLEILGRGGSPSLSLAGPQALSNPFTSSPAELDAAEQAASVRCERLRADGKTSERQTKEGRESLATVTSRFHQTERTLLLLRSEEASLQKQAAAIRARYPDDLEAAAQATSEDFALATHALKVAEAQLPADAGTLPERNRRAAVAAEHVALDLERCRSQLATLQGRLELGGSSGLHGREGTLTIRRDALRVQVTQARARSRAARLVHDLIERRQGAATRTVLAPLQERLGARFAEVSGERERRIFLDESLTVRGLGRKDGELVPFSDLSQGAKEQLLLCLRLAIAEELAAGDAGPQSLILDDVLVNTDAARQERVLTLLDNAAANGLQILVCTCHPDRYRGVGKVVALQRG